MAETTFVSGSPVNISYTPTGGAVAEGQVIVIGTVEANTTGTGAYVAIAPLAIANNVAGSLSLGGGIYEVVNLNNAVNGAKVWWSDSVNKVTTTGTNNAVFGFVVADGGGGANSVCKALHSPTSV
jgi:predicted RecA/RadA family phage recombinase